MTDSNTNLDRRLPALRIRDVILAALQSTFALPDLFGRSGNPFLFMRDDPKSSNIWISTPTSATKFERDGRRALVTVERMEYIPDELHLLNLNSANFSDTKDYTDKASAVIVIRCQHGSETAVENVASICYHILKVFRPQLMRDYDIHSIRMLGISPPVPVTQDRDMWECTVNLRVEVQEDARMIDVANHLNHLDISAAMKAIEEEANDTIQTIVSLDGPLPP